ncbi:MAG: sel1 repeat family protein [Gammaproteobacteria bacterium]|nr:sel1 repeat family protein [Gammaproteobacteria bacterium]
MKKPDLFVIGLACLLFSVAAPGDKPAPETMDKPPAAASVDKFRVGVRAFNANQFTRARELWLPLAESGDVRAQYAIGRLYEKGNGVERDLETAISWYQKAADRGHADSEYRLAVGYAYGMGIARDEAKALSWLRRAANHGQKRAQKVLAQAYKEGRLGLAADPEQAQYWYDKANSGS